MIMENKPMFLSELDLHCEDFSFEASHRFKMIRTATKICISLRLKHMAKEKKNLNSKKNKKDHDKTHIVQRTIIIIIF